MKKIKTLLITIIFIFGIITVTNAKVIIWEEVSQEDMLKTVYDYLRVDNTTIGELNIQHIYCIPNVELASGGYCSINYEVFASRPLTKDEAFNLVVEKYSLKKHNSVYDIVFGNQIVVIQCKNTERKYPSLEGNKRIIDGNICVWDVMKKEHKTVTFQYIDYNGVNRSISYEIPLENFEQEIEILLNLFKKAKITITGVIK